MANITELMKRVFERVIGELPTAFKQLCEQDNHQLTITAQLEDDQRCVLSVRTPVIGARVHKFELRYEPDINQALFCLYREPDSLLSPPNEWVFGELVQTYAEGIARRLVELSINRQQPAAVEWEVE